MHPDGTTQFRDDENTMRAHAIALMVAALLSAGTVSAAAANNSQFIVQGLNADAALHKVGAKAERPLEVIHAVSASLNAEQVATLRATAGIRVYEDRTLRTSGSLFDLVKSTVNNTNSTVSNVFVVQSITQLVTTPTVSLLVTNPLVSSVTQPIVSMPAVTTDGTRALLTSGVIALVGSALLGIASLVRRKTRN